jgi:hypothetical protein
MKRRQIRVDGLDPNGIRRVFGYADMEEDARREAMFAAAEYVERRPDTKPLEKWNFVPGRGR